LGSQNIETDESDTESISSRKSSAAVLSSSPSRNKAHSSALYNHRIILTTYPGQVGISPIPLLWGHGDPNIRGPIVASRNPGSLKLRNAIGAHGGSYCIYRALAVASGAIAPSHKPDLRNTEPAAKIGPHPSWGNPDAIVSMDPFGHVVAEVYSKQIKEGLDIRPTIAITKAHMRVPELIEQFKAGNLKIDGKWAISDGELLVTKAAIEPVWFLPGIANRFHVDETTLRRALL